MARDYNNYDHLAVSVKSDQLERILQCYRALGWTEVTTVDDRQYYDMKYVRLRRPHFIENKDRLQYLQVRMETAINSLVTITRRAHVKSNLVLALAAVALVCMAAAGIWLALAFNGPLATAGIIIAGCGVLVMIAGLIAYGVLRRREKKAAAARVMDKLRLTQSLISEAVALAPVAADAAEGFDDEADDGLNASAEGFDDEAEDYIPPEEDGPAADGDYPAPSGEEGDNG